MTEPAQAKLHVGTLVHELLRLEPLTLEHIPGMERAAEGETDRSGFASVPSPRTAADFVRDSIARGAAGDYVGFAQVTAEGRVVGHTSYLAARWWPGGDRLLAVEIGNTWLHPDAQGTALNSVAKLLLLGHAFETWQVARVDIKTDARNERARAGIRAVGAAFEGVLRNWQPSAAPGEEGRPRDTAMHSITSAEWPEARSGLLERIERKRAAG